MFTFIHAADIHLDSPLRGLSLYDSAPVETIRNGCRKAFENLIDLAIAEKVSFVLLAGDLYDGDWKDYSTGIFLSKQMGRLDQHNILVFVVAGNHDAANRMTKALETPGNMRLLSSRKPESIPLDELNVVIHGQSFATQHVEENLAMGFPEAVQGMFNIGLLHTSLDGRPGHAVYAPCSADDLRSKGYQYWALGHVHEHEYTCKNPWIVFPGCIQGRHIREAGEKGCVLVRVEDGEVRSVEKHLLDVLRWVECKVDLTDVVDMRNLLENTRKSIEDKIEGADQRPVAMRIRFEGATPLSGQLAAYPERFEQQIKAFATEIGSGDLWIERVENATRTKRDLQATLTDDTTLAKLLHDILSASADSDKIDGLDDIIANLRQKIPLEVFGPGSVLNLDEEKTLERLITEAKQLLLGRLLTVEENR